MFDELLHLVTENPASYSLKLNAKGRQREANPVLKYKMLNEWIDRVTAFKLSDPFYKTSTTGYCMTCMTFQCVQDAEKTMDSHMSTSIFKVDIRETAH